MTHIFAVEDDPIVADVLGKTLEEASYFKITANTFKTALFGLKHNQIDAALLGANLPDGDGTRLTRLIRKNHMPMHILVVSGNIGIGSKITTLGAGADGYLTKPFDRYELVANLDVITRRTQGHSSAAVNVGNPMVDLSRNYAKISDTRLDLSAKEFLIIEFLALSRGAV